MEKAVQLLTNRLEQSYYGLFSYVDVLLPRYQHWLMGLSCTCSLFNPCISHSSFQQM